MTVLRRLLNLYFNSRVIRSFLSELLISKVRRPSKLHTRIANAARVSDGFDSVGCWKIMVCLRLGLQISILLGAKFGRSEVSMNSWVPHLNNLESEARHSYGRY